jgi:hypothetical protein
MRLVKWRILPPDCVPDSCIVNMYDPGDCIPPHIDSHDFVRPFCTVSFLSECNILFGSSLKIAGPGEFTGSFAIPLPVGYVGSLLPVFFYAYGYYVLFNLFCNITNRALLSRVCIVQN